MKMIAIAFVGLVCVGLAFQYFSSDIAVQESTITAQPEKSPKSAVAFVAPARSGKPVGRSLPVKSDLRPVLSTPPEPSQLEVSIREAGKAEAKRLLESFVGHEHVARVMEIQQTRCQSLRDYGRYRVEHPEYDPEFSYPEMFKMLDKERHERLAKFLDEEQIVRITTNYTPLNRALFMRCYGSIPTHWDSRSDSEQAAKLLAVVNNALVEHPPKTPEEQAIADEALELLGSIAEPASED